MNKKQNNKITLINVIIEYNKEGVENDGREKNEKKLLQNTNKARLCVEIIIGILIKY